MPERPSSPNSRAATLATYGSRPSPGAPEAAASPSSPASRGQPSVPSMPLTVPSSARCSAHRSVRAPSVHQARHMIDPARGRELAPAGDTGVVRPVGTVRTLHNVHYRRFRTGVGAGSMTRLSRLTEHVESQSSCRKGCRKPRSYDKNLRRAASFASGTDVRTQPIMSCSVRGR